MRNGDDRNHGSVILAGDCQHDHAGAILAAFFQSCLMLVMPEVGVGKNEAELRGRKRRAGSGHSFSSRASR